MLLLVGARGETMLGLNLCWRRRRQIWGCCWNRIRSEDRGCGSRTVPDVAAAGDDWGGLGVLKVTIDTITALPHCFPLSSKAQCKHFSHMKSQLQASMHPNLHSTKSLFISNSLSPTSR
jgi:hypothetical protein